MELIVGQYTHPKTQVLTRQYETASWYSKHEVQAGAQGEVKFDGYWFFTQVPAVEVESYFVNRVLWASSAQHSHQRKTSTFGFQWDRFGIVPHIENGHIILNGWHVETIGEYSDGRPMKRAVHD